MRIPDEIKEQIRMQSDIVEIISEVVDLKKRGANYLGLCPFHNEKTPSFTVSEDKRIFKCFGCGESGDTITFMMKYHGLSYPEALKELAKRLGIHIAEEEQTEEEKQRLSRKDLAFKALEAARDFYVKQLYSQNGKIAQSYYNKRAFSLELIKEFGLGYSIDSWDALKSDLIRQNFPESALIDAGLLIQNEENNSSYDRFRGRAMFPIQDFLGRVIGFGARQLEDDKKKAKYINSPQSLVYDKSYTLYGLFQGKNELRSKKYALLTEGYADVLSLHQAGFNNAIASSGTSLTTEQLGALSRYCKKIFIVYDSDPAGVKATERGLELAIKEGFDVKVVQLPQGEDPDSLIRKHGAKMFRTYIDNAELFLDFKVKLLKEKGALDDPSEKAESIRSLIKIVSLIPDRLQHDEYISRLAQLLKLSETQLQRIYKEKEQIERKDQNKKRYRAKAAQRMEEQPTPLPDDSDIPRHEVETDYSLLELKTGKTFDQIISGLTPAELLLINLAVCHESALSKMTDEFSLTHSAFITEEGKRLFSIITETCGDKDVLDDLRTSEDIEESDKSFFINLALSEYQYCNDWDKYQEALPEIDLNRKIKDAVNEMALKKAEDELNKLYTENKELSIEEQLKYLPKLSEITTTIDKLKKALQYN